MQENLGTVVACSDFLISAYLDMAMSEHYLTILVGLMIGQSRSLLAAIMYTWSEAPPTPQYFAT
jgi:hypothetical protein